MIKFKSIKTYRNNSGTPVAMDLYNTVSGETIQNISIPQIKEKMLNGLIELEGFSIESGRLLDKRNTKKMKADDVLTQYYESCKLLGIKPLNIVNNNGEYVVMEIPTGSEVIIPKFVSRINVKQNRTGVETPKLPAVRQNNNTDILNKISDDNVTIHQDLQGIKENLGLLGLAVQQGFNSTSQELSDLHQQIADSGLTVQGYVDDLVEKLDYLVNSTIKPYEFPRNKRDRHYIGHYNKENPLGSEQAFLSTDWSDASKYGVIQYDEDLINRVTDICKIVNDIRLSMVATYETDIKRRNSEAVKKNKAKVKDLVKLIEYSWVASLGTEILKAGTTIAVYTVFVSGAHAIGHALMEAMPVIKTTKTKLNSYRLDDGGDINPRLGGVYNGFRVAEADEDGSINQDDRNKRLLPQKGLDFTSIDTQVLKVNNISFNVITADEGIFNSFSIDINAFVVDCLNTLVRKNMVDWSNIKWGSGKDSYYKFIKGSLCRYPVDEVCLYRFYCKYYLTAYADLDLTIESYGYSSSNSDIEAKKVYFDLVTNAYFTAKKLLLIKPDSCDYLKGALRTSVTSEGCRNFLYLMKLSLIIQGLTPKYTEELLDIFVDYSGLSSYL